MKLHNAAIALGLGAAQPVGISLLKLNKENILVSFAVVVGAEFMIGLRNKDDANKTVKDYEYSFNRAQDKFEVENHEGAIHDYNKALDFDPLYAEGYFNRSSAKFKIGDFAGAIDDYSQVIKINPKDSYAFFNRAKVKKEIGDLKGAGEDWRKAIELGDKEAEKLLKENCE
tara:strand:- start:120 stop:632 length:513 start_codon:yes stop_codon:yes gene_type:complete